MTIFALLVWLLIIGCIILVANRFFPDPTARAIINIAGAVLVVFVIFRAFGLLGAGVPRL